MTTIGFCAFDHCTEITSVIIPDSVTEIGLWSFSSCNLTSINIPYSVKIIGHGAFICNSELKSINVEAANQFYHSSGNCLIETETKLLIQGCSNSVIPTDGSVTGISESAFDRFNDMESIIIPKSVTFIDVAAFAYCTSLTDVYYTGSEQEKNAIIVCTDGGYNKCLLNATWHYNYVPDAECTHLQTEIRNAQGATCCEAGYTGDTYCADCGEKITTGSVIPATGNHVDADGKWESDGSQHWHTCYYGTKFDVASHTGGTATCTQKAKCSVCGVEYGDYARHKLTYHASVVADYENDGNIEYWTCDECGKYFSDSEGKTEITEDDVIIPKLVINEYKFIDNEVVICNCW